MPTPEEYRDAQEEEEEGSEGMSPTEVNERISEFYSVLSGYLDTLFDDSRWASSGPYLSIVEWESAPLSILDSLRGAGVSEEILDGFKTDASKAVASWFAYVKDRIDRETVGRLQAEFDHKAEAWEQGNFVSVAGPS